MILGTTRIPVRFSVSQPFTDSYCGLLSGYSDLPRRR